MVKILRFKITERNLLYIIIEIRKENA